MQISSRLFIDDLEKLLQERYDDNLRLEKTSKENQVDFYIQKYFQQKLVFELNGEKVILDFVGREFEDDMVYCYFEVLNVNDIKSLIINNRLLFEIFENQQNIVHFNINDKKKSFLLVRENDKGVLNF